MTQNRPNTSAIEFSEPKNNSIVIKFRISFRNKLWADSFGEVQKIMSSLYYKDIKISKIVFDFSDCVWIDPLPILSLLISCKYFVINEGIVNFILVNLGNNDSILERLVVIKFLKAEGFLSEMIKCGNLYDQNNNLITDDYINRIDQIIVNLHYNNSCLIPATIIDVLEIDNKNLKLENWLEKSIQDVRSHLISTLIEDELEEIVYRLKSFLNETLHNVKKHAYPGKTKCYAGFYVRLRYGYESPSITLEEKNKIREALLMEMEHCPKLHPDFVKFRHIFIEVFVIDNGIGMSETLKDYVSNTNTYRGIWEIVFELGLRNKSKVNRNLITAQGGLYTIGQYMMLNNDYICSRDGKEWFGSFFPLNNYHSTYLLTNANFLNNAEVNGLSWIARLSPSSLNIGSNKSNWVNWNGSPHRHPAYLVLSQPNIVRPVMKYNIVDNRTKEATILKEKYEKKQAKPLQNTFLFLPGSNFSKAEVLRYIRGTTINFSNLEEGQKRTLIIADIDDREKINYLAALKGVFFKKTENNFTSKITKIILITKLLSVSILELNDSTYVLQMDIESYFENPKNEIWQPEKYLAHAFAWIRWHDSQLFWEILKEENHPKLKQLFLREEIFWNNNLKINGYLDFAQILTIESLKKLLLLQLSRCKAFFSEEDCYINTIDLQTANLAEEFKNTISSSDYSINIGSVYVDGSASFIKTNVNKENLFIYFFIHPSYNIKNKFMANSLLLWPEKQWLDLKILKGAPASYQRLGKSHLVGPHGTKYFPIPRYKNSIAAYFRNPIDTYKDWQNENKKLSKFGNFIGSSGSGELFKFDLKKAIIYSFRFRDDSLSDYLVSSFFLFLGGKDPEKQLTTEGNIRYGVAIKKKLEQNILNNTERSYFSNVAAIVFPNNYETMLIIDSIRKYIKDKTLLDKIFPLNSLTPYRSGSTLLVSPLSLESLKNYLNQRTGAISILIFDTIAVTGRTKKEIKYTLMGLVENMTVSIKNIKSFTILDRSRLPFYTPDQTLNRSYWRIDIPRLGKNFGNPLNRALNLAAHLLNYIGDPIGQDRIKKWHKSWAETYQNNDSSEIGIKPSKLDKLIYKKYSIYNVPPFDQIGGDENKIVISNSLGLCLYATEIHAMAGNDDIALELLHEYRDILSDSIIIELISSQLLLFEGEFNLEVNYQMILELYKASLNIIEDNNHTSLASLTLILQKNIFIRRLWHEAIKFDNENSSIQFNNDLKLVMTFFSQHSEYDKIFNDLNLRFLFTNQKESLIRFYIRFHNEIYARAGTMHTPHLNKVSDPSTSWPDRLKIAIESMGRILFFLKRIPEDRIRNFGLINNERIAIESILNSILGNIHSAEKLLFNSSTTNINEELHKLLYNIKSDVSDPLYNLHERIFFPLIDEERPVERPFTRYLKNLTIEVEGMLPEAANEKGIVLPIGPYFQVLLNSPDYFPDSFFAKKQAWVLFDEFIMSEVRAYMGNVLYAGGQISNPWSNIKGYNYASMWIKIDIFDDCLNVVFVNASKEIASIIKYRHLKHRQPIKEIFEYEYDISFSFEDVYSKYDNKRLLQATLTLPIV